MTDRRTPPHESELNPRLQQLVALVATGLPVQQAARQAGFSPSYSRKASRLLKHPAVAQALARIQAEARTVVVYGLVEAMKEADDAAAFARKNKNSMALVKACELRAKLSGLLIDRIEVVPVDLRGVLEKAERRVINVTPLFSNDTFASSIHWAANIPGDNPVAEHTEAGPADGESGCR